MKASLAPAILPSIVLYFLLCPLLPTMCADEAAPPTSAGDADSPADDAQPPAAESDDRLEDEKPQTGPPFGPGRGMGRGFRGGRGFQGGRGPGVMGGFRPDMMTIHAMFDARDKIKRTVKMLPNGAESITESDDQEVAKLIRQHVPAMDDRVVGNEPLPPMTFHPVFVALIENSDKYTLDYEETEKGVKVTYQSDDPYVVMLCQEHAKLVSKFIANGMQVIHAPYWLPSLDAKAKEKAGAAAEALFKQLSGRLMEVMQAEGPAAAIEVCSREAPQIASAVGKQQGVKIGRTALKLRNPKNAAPDWVESLLEPPPAEPKFVELEDHATGALLPIKLHAKCVTCHGPKEELAEDIQAELAKHYPNDEATGFREGDLRGWLWVEVPQP